MKKILITSIGNRVSEAILDRLESRRSTLTVVGVNSIATAAGNFRADTVYLVPASEPFEPFLARMREILVQERPDLVLVGRNGDLAGLAILREFLNRPANLAAGWPDLRLGMPRRRRQDDVLQRLAPMRGTGSAASHRLMQAKGAK